MRLVELKPQLMRVEERDGQTTFVPVVFVAEAQGVRFLCPKCFTANGGSRGTHQVICWSRKAPGECRPGPGRWKLEGRTLSELTLAAYPGSTPSILLTGGCGWHGYVTNGAVTDA